jgi:hypothetical protein
MENHGDHAAIQTALRRHPNLVAYCDRITSRYFTGQTEIFQDGAAAGSRYPGTQHDACELQWEIAPGLEYLLKMCRPRNLQSQFPVQCERHWQAALVTDV